MVAFNEVQLQNLSMQAANGFQGASIEGMLNQYFGGTSLGNGINLSNVLAGIDSLEQIGNGDSQQQANGVQSLVNNIMGMIAKLGTGEATAAGSEVAKNTQNTNKTVTATEEQVAKFQSDFEGIQQNIETENQKIEAANKNAEELQKELDEKQKEVEERLALISAFQQQLGATTDPVEQKNLLAAITKELGNLNGCFESINTLKGQLESRSKEVEDAYSKLADYSTQANETQEDGIQNLENLAAQAQQNAQDNTKTQTTAPVNQATSAEAASAAAAASSNVFTGSSIAPKLYRIAADQGSAGSIRAIGASTVWAQMAQGIGKLTNGAEILTSYNNTIGSALSRCEDLVGSWNNNLSPMINSFGSIDNAAQQIESKLKPAVEQDNKTVDAEIEKQGIEYKEDTQKTDQFADIFMNSFANGTNGFSGGSTEPQVNELETPRIQIQFGL